MSLQTININPNQSKQDIEIQIRKIISDLNYAIVDEDVNRPWGGYFRFDEKHGSDFKQRFFSEVKLPVWAIDLPISPKILFTAPHKRLSWQYHRRRGEVWKMIKGDAAVYLRDSDQIPQNPTVVTQGSTVNIPVLYRHRQCAQNTWVIWAEMWIHTDPSHPSTEEDNVRVADDFGR